MKPLTRLCLHLIQLALVALKMQICVLDLICENTKRFIHRTYLILNRLKSCHFVLKLVDTSFVLFKHNLDFHIFSPSIQKLVRDVRFPKLQLHYSSQRGHTVSSL